MPCPPFHLYWRREGCCGKSTAPALADPIAVLMGEPGKDASSSTIGVVLSLRMHPQRNFDATASPQANAA